MVRQSGVYRILCVPTGKVYIGSSKNIASRWASHLSLLRRDEHHSPHLQHAWNKYGEGAFVFEVVELAEKAQLLVREQKWIGESRCCDSDFGYNVAPIADGGTRPGAGRPKVYNEIRIPIDSGCTLLAVDNDALALLPALLLHFPHAGTVEGVVALAVRRLAETTDD